MICHLIIGSSGLSGIVAFLTMKFCEKINQTGNFKDFKLAHFDGTEQVSRECCVEPGNVIFEHREQVGVVHDRAGINILQVDNCARVSIDVDHPQRKMELKNKLSNELRKEKTSARNPEVVKNSLEVFTVETQQTVVAISRLKIANHFTARYSTGAAFHLQELPVLEKYFFNQRTKQKEF